MWWATCVRESTKRVFVISLFMWYMHVSSVPRVFNHKSAHDKSACNKAETCYILNFFLHGTF